MKLCAKPRFLIYKNGVCHKEVDGVLINDIENETKDQWKTILPETKYPLSATFQANKDLIVAKYLQDGAEVFKVYKMPTSANKLTECKFMYDIKNPGLGEFAHINGKWNSSEILFKFHSFTNPGIIFKYDFNKQNDGVP